MNTLNWISINKQLPEDSDEVFITDGRYISTAHYFGKHKPDDGYGYPAGTNWWANQHHRLTSCFIDDNKVTHWLPISALIETLPEPKFTPKIGDVIPYRPYRKYEYVEYGVCVVVAVYQDSVDLRKYGTRKVYKNVSIQEFEEQLKFIAQMEADSFHNSLLIEIKRVQAKMKKSREINKDA